MRSHLRPENRYAGLRSYVYSAVRDHGRDELVPRAELITRSLLIAVVQLLRQVERVVGVQHGGRGILDRPKYAVLRKIGGDAGRGARIGEGGAGLAAGICGELSIDDLEGLDVVADSSE